jgi:hypothetical protein
MCLIVLSFAAAIAFYRLGIKATRFMLGRPMRPVLDGCGLTEDSGAGQCRDGIAAPRRPHRRAPQKPCSRPVAIGKKFAA